MPEFKITYQVDVSPPRITCLVCNMTSYNTNDIAYLYCGNCHAYHNIRVDEEGKPIHANVIPKLNQP